MKKVLLSFLLLSIAVVTHATNEPAQHAHGARSLFSVEYTSQAKNKPLSLKNATLKTKIFYYGNPMGIEKLTTDENQQFAVKKYKNKSALILEVLSIADQKNSNMSCYGANKIGQLKVTIKCRPQLH